LENQEELTGKLDYYRKKIQLLEQIIKENNQQKQQMAALIRYILCQKKG
tara:strand:+ start:233 stop:379 length:147 start_codon:yes stop_codon:yes gene_type:complete